MKKKLFILVLAASICGSVLFGGNAFAVDVPQCTVSNTSASTPKYYCAGSLFRTYSNGLALVCRHGDSFSSSCVTYVKQHIVCGSTTSVSCDTLKASYANEIAEIMKNNNVHPCASETFTDASGYNACTGRAEYKKFYYPVNANNQTINVDPNTGAPTSGGSGTGGGGGGSSPSSPDSGDDSGSSTEPIDPSAVNEGKCTSILPNAWCEGDDGIQQIIRLIIAILTGSIVVAGTIGLVICGVLWMTARENEQQVTTAKKRMLDIVIGVVAWVLLALLANLFIPKPSSEIDGTSVVTSKEKIV